MQPDLSPNMEMYLRIILELERGGEPVRVNAIAKALGVRKPSVSGALRSLKAKGLVHQESYGAVHLSDEGLAIAEQLIRRYEVLRRFLADVLRLEKAEIDRQACKLEHALSPDTSKRLGVFLDFLAGCNLDLNQVLEHFQDYLERRMAGGHCPECETSSPRCGPSREA